MCECEIGVDFAYLVEIAAVTLKIFNERIKMQKRKKKNRMCTRYNRMKKFETRKLHWYLYITEFINICNTFYSKRNEILKTITLSQEQTNVVKEIDKQYKNKILKRQHETSINFFLLLLLLLLLLQVLLYCLFYYFRI